MLRSAFLLTLVALPVTAPVSAQSKVELKKQLETRRAKIDKADGKKLYALALWAERKGLKFESKRLLREVLKADTDHEAAREALGYVKHDKKWVKADEVAKLEKRAKANAERARIAELKKKGYVKHGDSWIKKSDLAWAELGLVRHEGKWMRRDDAAALAKGKVKHPRTGVWIKEADADKAKQGLFPVGDDWVPVAKANSAHSDWEAPWVLRSDNVELQTIYPLEKAEQVLNEAETAVSYARGLLFDPLMPLPERVRIRIFDTAAQYREFGANTDDTGFSSYGAFNAYRAEPTLIACHYGQKDWGPYFLKHAVGMGVASQLLKGKTDKDSLGPTHWLFTGFGSYVERWSNSRSASHFGKQYLQKGGIRGLKSFPSSFKISADMSAADLEWNVYQAGIIISFLAKAPDAKTKKAWDKVRSAIQSRKGIAKAVKGFEKRLPKIEKQLKAHLAKAIRG